MTSNFTFERYAYYQKMYPKDLHNKLFELTITYKTKTIKTNSFKLNKPPNRGNYHKPSKRIIRDDPSDTPTKLSRLEENLISSSSSSSNEDLKLTKKKNSLSIESNINDSDDDKPLTEFVGNFREKNSSRSNNLKEVIPESSSSSIMDDNTYLKDFFGIQQIDALDKYMKQNTKTWTIKEKTLINQITNISIDILNIKEVLLYHKDENTKMKQDMINMKQDMIKQKEEITKMEEKTNKSIQDNQINWSAHVKSAKEEIEKNKIEHIKKFENVVEIKKKEIIDLNKNKEKELNEYTKKIEKDFLIIIENKKKEIEEEIKNDFKVKLAQFWA